MRPRPQCWGVCPRTCPSSKSPQGQLLLEACAVSSQNHAETTPEKREETPTFNITEYLCKDQVRCFTGTEVKIVTVK